MKRYLITLFVILSCLSSKAGILEFGIEGGPSLSSLRGNDIIDDYYDSKIGFAAGGFVQFGVFPFLSLKTGLMLERKGSSADMPVTDSAGTIIGDAGLTSNFDYLVLPVLLKGSFGAKTKIFVNAGPYLSYLVKQVDIVDATGTSPRLEIEHTKDFKNLDIGFSIGAGVKHPLFSKVFISLEVRHNFGITDITDLPSGVGESVYTSSYNLLAGLGISL